MQVKDHLTLLRFVRVVSMIAGLGIIIPFLIDNGNVIELSDAGPFLIGLAIILLPHGLLIGLLPAECPACGGRAFAEAKRFVASASKQNNNAGQIRYYVWKCEDCKNIEKLEATWFDRMTSPSSESSSDQSSPADFGDS